MEVGKEWEDVGEGIRSGRGGQSRHEASAGAFLSLCSGPALFLCSRTLRYFWIFGGSSYEQVL